MKVLITGSLHNTGIAAIYGLAKERCEIIGADERLLPFNIHSRHTGPNFKHAPFSDNQFYKDILSLVKKEKPDVLLSIGGTQYLSLNKQEVLKYTNVLIPDYKSFISAFDKKITHKVCEEAGIAVPKLFTYSEAVQILQVANSTKLVVKPSIDAGGARGLNIVNNVSQLDHAIRILQNNYNDYIIEEFIPGASSMRAVQLVFNKNNKIVAQFILKKIHQYPVSGGITAYAVSTHEWELIDFVLPFFEKCSWEGPVEIELIIDERDGKPKLIEINPRYAGSIFFAVQCGVNFPYISCLAAIDKSYVKEPPCYDTGMFYINFSYYLKAILKELFLSKNKILFLNNVVKELKNQKTSTIPDKKDIIMHLAKAWKEITV